MSLSPPEPGLLSPARRQVLEEFARRLGYRFEDWHLLERALTHSSWAREDPTRRARDNESLEFLGDAIIGMVTAEVLYRRDPDGAEGRKAELKSHLVSATNLASRAEALGVPDILLQGRGERRQRGRRQKMNVWADAYEAVIAALYLDGGLDAAARVVGEALDVELADGAHLPLREPKNALQEWLQARGRPTPEYVVVAEEGEAAERTFTVECRVEGRRVAAGQGPSKKVASREAARQALDALDAR